MSKPDIASLVPQASLLLPDRSITPDFLVLADRERKELIRDLSQGIPHNRSFDKSEITKLREYKWMNEVEMNLIYNEGDESTDRAFLSNFLDILLSKADTLDREINRKNSIPVIALDLETFGLNKRHYREGGELINFNMIVSACLAITSEGEEIGYYLPLNHNEEDGVRNFKEEDFVWFLTELNAKSYQVYLNAAFDREMQAINRIRLTPNFTDIMWLATCCGLKEDSKSLLGLKHLSKQELDREMIELKDLMGGKFIPLVKFQAPSCFVYGCSDAINTLALFNLFVTSGDYPNPFHSQKMVLKYDPLASDATRSMLRFGQPIDHDAARGLLDTIVRRSLVISTKFDEIVHGVVEVSKAEQIGIYYGNLLIECFEREFVKPDYSETKKKEMVDKFKKKMEEDFDFEIKTQTLKSGVVKTKFGSKDTVLSLLIYHLAKEKYSWIPEKIRDRITNSAYLVSLYRTIDHDKAILAKFVRYGISDDSGICRVGIELKMHGTITTRYSNGSGKGDFMRAYVSEGKRGYTSSIYREANGVAGFNAQGIPNAGFDLFKAKKILKIGKEVSEHIKSMDREVEETRNEYLLGQ